MPRPEVGTPKPFLYVTELYGSIKVLTGEGSLYGFAENVLNCEPDYKMPRTAEPGGSCIDALQRGWHVHEQGGSEDES